MCSIYCVSIYIQGVLLDLYMCSIYRVTQSLWT